MQQLTRPTTMKQQLHLFIVKHGLAEVIERLMEVVEQEAEVRDDSHQLNQVAIHLQKARADSLLAIHHEWE